MRIINIIDSIEKVNFGIWNAAISTASILKNDFQVESELWYPETNDTPDLADVIKVPLKNNHVKSIDKLIASRKLQANNCIIVTHGCWQFPTRWGAAFKKREFTWIYVPHGMLEPWSLQQKRIKKKIYFKLIEYPLSCKADTIRAVGTPEWKNLKEIYNNTILIPNGIDLGNTEFIDKASKVTNYLFMARLHHKKGVLSLIKAWIESPQGTSAYSHLYIAGPDDGELNAIEEQIKNNSCTNITYTGAVYGSEKQELINKCHVYILPSHSEGFPTSVLEAMNNNLLAVITKGCNFPEAIQGDYALETTPNKKDICAVLNTIFKMKQSEIKSKASKGAVFVRQNYSLHSIAQLQANLNPKHLT